MRLCLALAMTDRVVGISLEWDVRVFPSHPTVEDIVKKQICQHGTYYCPLWCSSVSRNQGAIRHAYRCLQPPLQVEKDPFAVGVSTHGQHQEPPVDLVEEALDVQIEHPIVIPTTASGHEQCIMRRFSWTISIGILVEHGFQDRLQVTLDDHLSDSVGDRWNTKRSGSSRISLRDVYTSHGRREIASRAHPIPDPIEILTQIPIEVLKGLLVYPRRTPVRLHLPIRFPYIAFSYTKRLGSIHADHPLAGCPLDRDRMTTPLRSSPITGPSSLIRASPPLCSASVLRSLR